MSGFARPLVAFRAEASQAIGAGHIMRCLALADFLSWCGWECVFLVSDEACRTVPRLDRSPYKKLAGDTSLPCDWLVVDHYGLDVAYETRARAWARNVLVIDDLADRPHDCDMLLDQSLGRIPASYEKLAPGSRLLLGPMYALLRPEFAARRQEALQRDHKSCERVFVSFGGSVQKELIALTLEAIGNRPADVVAGLLAKEIPSAANVTIHHGVENMADLMVEADVAIGAAGSSAWERCCLGLPSLLVILADNQVHVANALEQDGAAVSLGHMGDVTVEAMSQALERVCESQIRDMHSKAAKITDGRGIARVALAMAGGEITEKGEQVTLSLFEPANRKVLFDWQCAPGLRKWSRNQEPPTWDEHCQWFDRKLHTLESFSTIIMLSGQPAGMLRLEPVEEGLEVSIIISPDHQRCGIAKAGLKLARNIAPGRVLVAEVHPNNKASHNLFSGAGYEFIEGKYRSFPPLHDCGSN